MLILTAWIWLVGSILEVMDLAAVDCPKHSEEEQGEDDIDADLNTKPELVVQLHDGLNDVDLDEDVADNHRDGAADGEEDGQGVEETSEYGSSSCRGQESFNGKSTNNTSEHSESTSGERTG